MATTQRRGMPARRPVTHRAPAPTMGGRLTSGFDSLTLNPAPRLHEARQRLGQRNPVREAWKITVRAVVEAVQEVLAKPSP